MQLNYNELFEKAERILHVWSLRTIPLLAKVQVVNTLIYSLFVYRMTVMDSLPHAFKKQFQSLVSNYIWDGGRPKISYDILKLAKDQGGLGLVSMADRDTAIKIGWINKLRANAKMKTLAYEVMGNPIGDLVWNIELEREEIGENFRNSFCTEILDRWNYFNKTHFERPALSDQIIWFNSKIQIGNKPVFWKNWFEKGIIQISDLMNNDQLLTTEQILVKFPDLPFIQIAGLRKAISTLAVEKEFKEDYKSSLEFYESIAKVPRAVYHTLVGDELVLEISLAKCNLLWSFTDPLDIESFKDALLKINRITISVKLRTFQYKLLLSAILTNIRLFYMGLVDSKLCYQCGNEVESYRHLFLDCPKVRNIWEWLSTIVKVPLSDKGIVLNNIIANPLDCINTLMLYTKYYIFRSKCCKERMSITALKRYIIKRIKCDEAIAKSKNKLASHKLRWDRIPEEFYMIDM